MLCTTGLERYRRKFRDGELIKTWMPGTRAGHDDARNSVGPDPASDAGRRLGSAAGDRGDGLNRSAIALAGDRGRSAGREAAAGNGPALGRLAKRVAGKSGAEGNAFSIRVAQRKRGD